MNRGFIAAAALIAGALLFTACRKGIAMNGPEGGPGVPQTSAVPKGSSPEGTWYEQAENADLLISEATYGENAQAELAIDHGHMNFAQAAAIAKQAGVKQLWLAHYSQMIQDLEACLPNAQSVFARTALGMDGMKTTLQFEK